MARFEPDASAEGPSGDVRVVVMMLAAQSQALAVRNSIYVRLHF
jgi:hypothetical protein